ncbi:hypothetical protein QCA50_004418 [Cerrena zonata]|uniref:Uncharacterized protein n=1 Tax=Cerrena zonata TaxID=2478898 RepID=A0AAW0GTW1_9APHY
MMLHRRQEVTDTPATISLDSQYVLLRPSSSWHNVSNEACADGTVSTPSTTNHFTNQVGAYGTFSFIGDRIVLNGIKTPAGGRLQITLDGNETFNQDLTSSDAFSECAVLFDLNLVNGTHSVLMTLQAQNGTSTNTSSTPELHLFNILYFFPINGPTAVGNTGGQSSASRVYTIIIPAILGVCVVMGGVAYAYKMVKRTIFRFRYPA